jgi:hypothetical protein
MLSYLIAPLVLLCSLAATQAADYIAMVAFPGIGMEPCTTKDKEVDRLEFIIDGAFYNAGFEELAAEESVVFDRGVPVDVTAAYEAEGAGGAARRQLQLVCNDCQVYSSKS